MIKKQIRTLSLALLAAVSLVGYTQAQINLDFDSATIGVGASETLNLTGAGTDAIDNITFVLIVEDGGQSIGGSASNPLVTAINPEGLFDSAGVVTSFAANFDPATSPLAVIGTFDNVPLAAPGAAPAPLASINFDTTSLAVGDTFDLFLDAADFGSPQTTLVGDGGTEIPSVFADSFTIEVIGDTATPGIPEPGSFCMLVGMCGATMLRRRRRA